MLTLTVKNSSPNSGPRPHTQITEKHTAPTCQYVSVPLQCCRGRVPDPTEIAASGLLGHSAIVPRYSAAQGLAQ